MTTMSPLTHTHCSNCLRSHTKTSILLHHVIPRQSGGVDDISNRMPLCKACERFLHFLFTNDELAKMGWDVLHNSSFESFGHFVVTSDYVRRQIVEHVAKDFILWQSKQIKEGNYDAC